jgi:putative RecB family exonuclease
MSTELVTRESLQKEESGLLDHVSYSRLALWLSCPLAFKFRYIDGIETPASPALFLGRTVHAGLECHYRHRQLGIPLELSELTQRFRTIWERMATEEQVAFANVEEEGALRQQGTGLVNAYLQQLPAHEPKPLAVEVAIEEPLIDPDTGEDLGIPMVGVIDLVLGGETGPLIVDFKTSSRNQQPAEIAHELQMACYSYLFRRATHEQEVGLEFRHLVKTKVPQVHYHPFQARSKMHFQRLFTVIRAYLDSIHSGKFIYRPNWACATCDYRDSPCAGWCG